MPKELSKTRLSTVTPTPEELATARAAIASMNSEEKNSKMGSMRAFLRKNPDAKAIGSKREKKQQMLELFHVHVARNKQTEKCYIGVKEVELGRKLMKQLNWASEEQMDLKFGINPSVCKELFVKLLNMK